MTEAIPKLKANRKRKWLLGLLGGGSLLVIAGVFYVRSRPLVFIESFFSHAHCMVQVGLSFRMYAQDHGGTLPFHTNGYGDALVILMAEYGDHPSTLTGPGYDPAVFMQALTNHYDVPEAECGRVYVQGLNQPNNPDIAIFFDTLPTPGGDHCHLLKRLSSPLGRELWTLGGDSKFIKENGWPEFAKNQIDLLVREGFDKETAAKFYAKKGTVR